MSRPTPIPRCEPLSRGIAPSPLRPLFRPLAAMAVVVLALVGPAACGNPEIEPPTPLYGEDPVLYPVELWDQGLEGTTVLRIRVTDTGEVDSVEVAESAGHDGLDEAAVAGAKELRFQPGRRNGKRVRMWASLPVEFSTRPRARTDR